MVRSVRAPLLCSSNRVLVVHSTLIRHQNIFASIFRMITAGKIDLENRITTILSNFISERAMTQNEHRESARSPVWMERSESTE